MSQDPLKNSLKNGPNEKGYYGEFGSRYAPEILMPSLIELEKAFNNAINDKKFIEEFEFYLKEWVGRPNPLYFAEELTKKIEKILDEIDKIAFYENYEFIDADVTENIIDVNNLSILLISFTPFSFSKALLTSII